MLKTLVCTLLYRAEGKMVVLACQGAYFIHPVTSASSNYQTIYWLYAHNLLCTYAVTMTSGFASDLKIVACATLICSGFSCLLLCTNIYLLITWSTCCLSSKWPQVKQSVTCALVPKLHIVGYTEWWTPHVWPGMPNHGAVLYYNNIIVHICIYTYRLFLHLSCFRHQVGTIMLVPQWPSIS